MMNRFQSALTRVECKKDGWGFIVFDSNYQVVQRSVCDYELSTKAEAVGRACSAAWDEITPLTEGPF